MHYHWLKTDPDYPALYKEAYAQAGDALRDDAVKWSRLGIFEPIIYQGQFQFAHREIVLCTLPDGREVPEEKLPEPIADCKVVSRRTVHVPYGPPLGIYRRSEGHLARLLKAFKRDEFGDHVKQELTGPNGQPLQPAIAVTFVDAEEGRRKK